MFNKEKKGWWAQEYQNSNQVRTHLKQLHSLFEGENECSSLSLFFGWVGVLHCDPDDRYQTHSQPSHGQIIGRCKATTERLCDSLTPNN